MRKLENKKWTRLPRISVVIPTRNRPDDLSELLQTILNQSYPPFEVIIIDDSLLGAAKHIFDSCSPKFRLVNCRLKYVRGSSDGLTAARNLGVKISEGDALLFLDDDILLGQNVISALAIFLRDNSIAVGVQPKILNLARNISNGRLGEKFEKAVFRVLALTYDEENKLAVGRSGTSIFPSELTRVISAQRLSGCCCCYRRELFNRLRFDTNLKRWGFLEDLDFSFRVYKAYPDSLYAIPHAKIIHKRSEDARLPTKPRVYMTTIYWFYVFLKDIFESSILNLIAFLWVLAGNLITNAGGLIIKRKPKSEWWTLIYLLESYATALRNLKNIRMLKLEFFNKNLRVA
jgi:GT2 family glycosyltransferase